MTLDSLSCRGSEPLGGCVGRHMITSMDFVPCGGVSRVFPLRLPPLAPAYSLWLPSQTPPRLWGHPSPCGGLFFSCWNLLFVPRPVTVDGRPGPAPRGKGAAVTLLTCILSVCFRGPREASEFGEPTLLSRLNCCRKGWWPRLGARGSPAGLHEQNPHLI